MKIISVILTWSMLLPLTGGVSNLLGHAGQEPVACCHHRDLSEHPSQDREQTGESGDHDHVCPFGCDCGCCIHILAIEFHYYANPGILQQPFHFTLYRNDYRFDFYTPVFEPPRLV